MAQTSRTKNHFILQICSIGHGVECDKSTNKNIVHTHLYILFSYVYSLPSVKDWHYNSHSCRLNTFRYCQCFFFLMPSDPWKGCFSRAFSFHLFTYSGLRMVSQIYKACITVRVKSWNRRCSGETGLLECSHNCEIMRTFPSSALRFTLMKICSSL